VIGEALEELKSSTTAPELATASLPDIGRVKDLLSRCTMSDMRERFVAQILDGQPVAWTDETTIKDAASEGGSMELF
jgi:methyl-accepting chemotaxis protein